MYLVRGDVPVFFLSPLGFTLACTACQWFSPSSRRLRVAAHTCRGQLCLLYACAATYMSDPSVPPVLCQLSVLQHLTRSCLPRVTLGGVAG